MSEASDTLFQSLSNLSAAEEFFQFFGVPYEQAVVHVNRLHILKRFQQYLRTTPGLAELDRDALHGRCQELLVRAYQDFVRSTPAQEKVFKVFQDMDGQQVALDKLRATLPSRRETADATSVSRGPRLDPIGEGA
jgi:nitrogenase-stabilizing/protective protein